MKSALSLIALAGALAATPVAAQDTTPPTSAAAKQYVDQAAVAYRDQNIRASRAEWVYSTYINDDTEALNAEQEANLTKMLVSNAGTAAKLADAPGLDYDTNRILSRMRTLITTPAPTRAGAAEQVATLKGQMQGIYGKGKGTLNGQPINGSDIEAAMGTSRNPAELKEMWTTWHDNVGTPMKDEYVQMIGLMNQGATELGYADTGALWRSNYDMDPDAFAALTEKIWQEVKPLYDQLHCYTRTKLNQKYGDGVQATTGPIRADLLGNMWAQEWGNIYDIVAPPGAGDIGFDTTELLASKGYDPIKMVKAGEGFFSSLGFDALPTSFYTRSQFVKPADREVICHASAWDIDQVEDLRIKMCTKVNGDDFTTIHHELGHNYYQRAYNKQNVFYLDGANDGFHEAIGDMVALSITPDYLVEVGLLDKAKVPSADKDLGLLLRQAMDKVAFLPFGLLIDRYRWDLFSGKVQPADYNKHWVDMKLKYQGITPPVARGAEIGRAHV